ncbi:hypothetical protein LX36DRAFT_581292, partial [Colletotrichum falcatum]
ASLANAVPKAHYLIARPPETVTVTACGYQCASTVTVTETLTETAPYFFTCEPSSTPTATGPLGSLTLSSSIIPPPPFTLSNTTSRALATPTSWATGPATSLNPPSSTETGIETSTPGVTVSSQLPSVRTPSSSFTWSVNSTASSRGSSSSYSYGTGTAGTTVTSARPSLPTSLWSNSTKPITPTIRSTGTDLSTTAKVTIPTIPSISIPPPPATFTGPNGTTSSGPSYTVTTYTTVRAINTTVSSQLPGASTLSPSTSVTTVRTTMVRNRSIQRVPLALVGYFHPAFPLPQLRDDLHQEGAYHRRNLQTQFGGVYHWYSPQLQFQGSLCNKHRVGDGVLCHARDHCLERSAQFGHSHNHGNFQHRHR